jgi:F-type H+-transporting ATPase subunit gamma
MPSLRDMRARIASVKNTQQITRAMKMVSAAKLRRAQDLIVNMRPYAQKTLQVIANVAVTQRVEHALLQVPQTNKSLLLVVLTSDRGLCGGFNNSVCRFTEKFLATEKSKYEKIDCIFIGKKGSDYFRRRGVNPRKTITNLAREISYHMAAEMAKTCMQEFMSGDYDEVRFVYNEFKSAISQNLVAETILPIDISKSAFNSESEQKMPFARDMIFEPNPEEMIEQLLAQHFAVQVFRCMAESVAAEHAARMTSMENATKNAKEMIDKLTLTYNKLRQASITRELIEICSGAEAIQ